jgi:hypothetical protein
MFADAIYADVERRHVVAVTVLSRPRIGREPR